MTAELRAYHTQLLLGLDPASVDLPMFNTEGDLLVTQEHEGLVFTSNVITSSLTDAMRIHFGLILEHLQRHGISVGEDAFLKITVLDPDRYAEFLRDGLIAGDAS